MNCIRPGFKVFRALSYLPLVTTYSRTLHFTPANMVKEIRVTHSENCTTIEGVMKESPRKELLLKTPESECGVCYLCALRLPLDYTDVLILSQFMTSTGNILPHRVTGLCVGQQQFVTKLIIMSKIAGLMPNLNDPRKSRLDPHKRKGAKKYHIYFDKKTLPNYSVKHAVEKYKYANILSEEEE